MSKTYLIIIMIKIMINKIKINSKTIIIAILINKICKIVFKI